MLAQTVRWAALGSVPILLNACKQPEFHCKDVSELSKADAALRTKLDYRDRSPYSDKKSCSSCAFFKGGNKNECGRCTLVKGPIHPLGYCNAWSAKG